MLKTILKNHSLTRSKNLLSFQLEKLRLRAAVFMLAGTLPVSSIALHCTGVLSLPHCLFFMILPVFFWAFLASARDLKFLKYILYAWCSGVIAVTIYDLSRIPFILSGWKDFIPHIATWLNGSWDHAYLIGYSWRYAGNGGGLGITFFLLADYFQWKNKLVGKGVIYGLCVFASLVFVLTVFPKTQEMMFRVSPLTFFGGLTGHIIYGFVLGKLLQRRQK